jgi:hypothetical protein
MPDYPKTGNTVLGTQADQSGETGDRKIEESREALQGPGWYVLAIGLAFAIGSFGVSAFLRTSGITDGELQWIMMLLLLPAEWAGALSILAFLDDFGRALKKKDRSAG